MSDYKRFTFRDKRGTEHEVGGRKFTFYPNRMALLTEARDLSTPVAQAVSVLFADESKDNTSNVKRHHEGDFFMEDIATTAISTEMAKYRQAERNAAIETIMGTLADARSIVLLGKLFMDSLRDEFPYKRDRGAKEVEEWLYGEEAGGEDEENDDLYTGLDLPMLVEMFGGWMKANAKVFGTAGEKMVGLVKSRLEQVNESALETTDPTSGNDSKIPSSPPLPQASMPSTSTD